MSNPANRGVVMFTSEQLERVVSLHEKSYRFLKWIEKSVRQETLSFRVAHEAMTAASAGEEWIGRHFENIPLDCRPRPEELTAFANLLASYLMTSFEPQPAGLVRVSDCGCYCDWCSYLQAGRRLKPRKPGKRAKSLAAELKRIYLTQLANQLSPDMPSGRLQGWCALADSPQHAYNVSLGTYVSELIRRTQFCSQGEGVLVLWREIAWDVHHPKKNFKLDAAEILAAQEQLSGLLSN